MRSADLLVTGPARADRVIVLAHGAGAPMDSPFMDDVSRGLASKGLRVVRFDFPYMQSRRRGELANVNTVDVPVIISLQERGGECQSERNHYQGVFHLYLSAIRIDISAPQTERLGIKPEWTIDAKFNAGDTRAPASRFCCRSELD